MLLDSIDVELTNLVGTRAKEAIYTHLASEHSLVREEIPTHLDEFRVGLKDNFGAAAPTIESFIARRFYSTLNQQSLTITNPPSNRHLQVLKEIAEPEKPVKLPKP